MSEALMIEKTVPAFPLGQPFDGRPRYGMTPEQARVYRWLVQNRPHDKWFTLHFRDMGAALKENISIAHLHVSGLMERGWIDIAPRSKGETSYRLIHPVRHFAEPRNG